MTIERPEPVRYHRMTGRRRMILGVRVLSALVVAIVTLALIGYATRSVSLVRIQPGLRGMSPMTAIGLSSLAVAAFAGTFRRATIVTLGCALAGIVGCLTLGSHMVAGGETFSQPLGSAVFGLPARAIGRTSVATAIGLLLLATALSPRLTRPSVADIIVGVSLVLSGTALLGYLYGVGDLYAVPVFNSMALNTAAALFLLSLATLFAEPETGWASVIASRRSSGSATRRQLTFIALPIVAGWILLRATAAAELGPAFAIALLVIVTIVPLAVLVLRDGRVLDVLERERQGRVDLQRDLTVEMTERLAAQADALAAQSAERSKAETAMFHAQRLETVGQLTGGIAHDFNNLLMAISGNLELIGRRLPTGDERLHRYLASATAATERGTKITGQLLAFSRSQRLDIRPIALEPILANACGLIGTSLGPDIEIALELDTPGAWILSDPAQLELAILNLAVNARDAMPDGGQIRIASCKHVERLPIAPEQSDYVAIRVTDTGTGMTEAVAAKAVEPFFTTRGQGKGTGLGLAQAYGFVRQCRGDLRIRSTPGHGTTIELLLPRAEPRHAVVAPASAVSTARVVAAQHRHKVLVIDDDDMVRGVIVEALRDAGFTVREAATGERGLALLDQFDPAAAVIDFIMPGMNGAEVARLAQTRRPGLPIVFVSGYSETVALDGIAGAIVLRKPFDVNGLSAALNTLLH